MNDPLPQAPDVPEKRHWNQKSAFRRIRFAGGPTIDTATLEQLKTWHVRSGKSYGELVDLLVSFVSTNKKWEAALLKATSHTSVARSPKPATADQH